MCEIKKKKKRISETFLKTKAVLFTAFEAFKVPTVAAESKITQGELKLMVLFAPS